MISPVKATVLPKEKTMANVGLKSFELCNPSAKPSVKKLSQYLSSASERGYVLYGHQNDLHRKAGPKPEKGFSVSDTYDVTNQFAAVTGIDALSLFGTEHGKWCWSRQNRLDAAVQLSMDGIENGAIVSLSAHMPNFQLIYDRLSGNVLDDRHWSGWENHPMVLVDGSTNFSGYTPNDLRGHVVEDVMPGKKLNALYREYLDLVCDYFLELDKKNVAAIWRPFHENTGGWFWWGCNTCSPEQFKALWQYTWNYMSKEKNVHNIIWAYSPGSENKCESDFLERYPGDSFVDMVGFDTYQQYPDRAQQYWVDFESQCALISSFAEKHGKLFANTETGVAHPDSKALLDVGNEDFDWYCKVAQICRRYGACYFLLWANFSASWAYYAPYVTAKETLDGKITALEGHELLDSFISMFNLDFTVFSGGTGDIFSLQKKSTSKII